MITVPAGVLEAIRAHAGHELPNEACGLFAGNGERIRFFYPLTNTAASPSRYTVDPDGHMGALSHAENQGWRLTGVFHSHPDGAAVPSVVDIEGALEPEWVHLILGADSLRAWTIRNGEATEHAVRFDA